MLAELKNIKKIVHDAAESRVLLSDINFTLDDNDIIALVGTSGAGKTALLRILGCLDNATQGEYLLNGTNVSGLSESGLAVVRRKSIGFLGFEPEFLDTMNVEECLEFPLSGLSMSSKEKRSKILEILEFIGLLSKLKTPLKQLPFPEKMHIAAARAFIKRPALIIADEPGKKLHSQESAALFELLASLRREYGGTLIFSTYDPAHLKKAYRLFYMKNGKIIKIEDV